MAGWRAKAEKISVGGLFWRPTRKEVRYVEEAKRAMAAAIEAARRKEEEKAQKEEITRALSEAGSIHQCGGVVLVGEP